MGSIVLVVNDIGVGVPLPSSTVVDILDVGVELGGIPPFLLASGLLCVALCDPILLIPP
jgi:hypothetical protein